ncbi:MAG: cysteine--tRNA ligase [Actinomycetota bacterium]
MRIYDTLQRSIVELAPADPEALTIYACGPTVYRPVHVGNLRTFLMSDLIRRVAVYLGMPVRLIQNITDVGHMTDELFGADGEDRMEQAAVLEGRSTEEIAEHYTQMFMRDTAAIGILQADGYPRASEHIEHMQELISKLIERGHAYEIDGTVYYDTHSFPDYGKLSGNKLEALEADHRKIIDDANKKHPSDFVLWKAAGPNRLIRFPSPWGEGYPGWHIECSAMSMQAFGETLDLHTGGEDNVFPHHEDEIAQSEGATGAQVVRHWMHGAHLLRDGRKMSKSARNDHTLADLAEMGVSDPLALRLVFLQARYRAQMNLTTEALLASQRALSRWRRLAEATGDVNEQALEPYEERFRDAIADDLDMPSAVALIGRVASDELLSPADRGHLLRRWDAVLGLGFSEGRAIEIPAEVAELVEKRADARANKDFAGSDALRSRIAELGFKVTDTPEGQKVRPL